MRTNRLKTILSRIRRLLIKHRVGAYLSKIDGLLGEVDKRAEAFAGKVRESFFRQRGMGSTADFVICQRNGHDVEPERETEVNFEFQALFDALMEAAVPRDDPNTGIKHFSTFPSTEVEWDVVLTSGNLECIFDVLIWITYHHPDWQWVQDWCLYFTRHPNLDVRTLAIRCLADLAQLHKTLESGKVLSRLGELMNDPEVEVHEQAAESLNDITSVLSVVS